MNLSNGQRVWKLATNLIKNPDLITPWVRTSILSKRYPLDYPLPWWSFRAIQAADEVVKGKRIFEYGSGGSTVRFSQTAKFIRCVEDDKKWLSLVKNKLSDRKIKNVELIHKEFNFKDPVNFEASDYLLALGDEQWDIVIIDGQDWTFKERLKCFAFVEPKMKPGSLIILDDFWRYTEVLEKTASRNVQIFESVGPCRLGVTSTAFFYY